MSSPVHDPLGTTAGINQGLLDCRSISCNSDMCETGGGELTASEPILPAEWLCITFHKPGGKYKSSDHVLQGKLHPCHEERSCEQACKRDIWKVPVDCQVMLRSSTWKRLVIEYARVLSDEHFIVEAEYRPQCVPIVKWRASVSKARMDGNDLHDVLQDNRMDRGSVSLTKIWWVGRPWGMPTNSIWQVTLGSCHPILEAFPCQYPSNLPLGLSVLWTPPSLLMNLKRLHSQSREKANIRGNTRLRRLEPRHGWMSGLM